jgi:outer membrane lipoprotein-sorting protein
MRPRIRPVGVIFAILASLLLAAPTAAASPWTSFSQSGTTASAEAYDCVENPDGTETCAGQHLFVFKGTMKASGEPTRKGDQVCYGEFSYTYDPETGEFLGEEHRSGCLFDAGTLTIDQHLTSATLAPTAIELVAWECDEFDCTETPAGSTVVYGTWTGFGPIMRHNSRSMFDDGSCIQVHADRSRMRHASFEGSFDAQYAQMSEGRFTFRTTCTVEEDF